MKMLRRMLGSLVAATFVLAAFASSDASLAQGHGGTAAGHKGADHTSCLAGAGITPCRVPNFFPGTHKKKDTYWVDTDGNRPDVAGCHIELISDKNHNPLPNGRHFGEKCETGTILIETNPEANKVHPHSGDYGFPYRIDCNKWCQFAKRGKKGACKPVPAVANYNGKPVRCQSAKCECSS